MKHTNLQSTVLSTVLSTALATELADTAADIWTAWRRQKLPLYLFLLLCLNLIVAPAVQAATGETFSRSQSYALGILGLATVAISIYLFVVMFQPERF